MALKAAFICLWINRHLMATGLHLMAEFNRQTVDSTRQPDPMSCLMATRAQILINCRRVSGEKSFFLFFWLAPSRGESMSPLAKQKTNTASKQKKDETPISFSAARRKAGGEGKGKRKKKNIQTNTHTHTHTHTHTSIHTDTPGRM